MTVTINEGGTRLLDSLYIVFAKLSGGGADGEKPITAFAKKVYTHTIKKKGLRTYQNYRRQVSNRGTVVAEKMERLHSILTGGVARTPVRRTHDLLCECRKCEPSLNSFWRYLKKELEWGEDGHLI